MDIEHEQHALDIVELVSTVVERFGIQINTFMATC
jgi:acyl carrier protein